MRVIVLSPHPDDATFSLALTLKRWSTLAARITVLNFFTRSAYAPYAPAGSDVSALRAREDRRSINAVDPGIAIRSLGMLDGPLRLSIDFGSITNPAVCSPRPQEVTQLARMIRNYCRASLVLAPLGLGEHIDHRTVRDAAIVAVSGKLLAFYEDLPYASWTSETAILERISELQARSGTPVTAVYHRSRNSRFKSTVVRKYRSQIDDRMASLIARYSNKYNGAERIWAPRNSARWRKLLNASQKTDDPDVKS